MNNLKLEVLTPDRMVVEASVLSVYLQGSNGRLGILPGHTTLISTLSFGVLEMETSKGKELLLCGQGVVEVADDRVTVLVRSAERSNDINIERAKAALNRAKSRRGSNDKDVDLSRAELALYRSIQRLQFSGHM